MSDRIEQMRIELMNDLYHVMGDPERVEAILNPAPSVDDDATDVAPLYFVAVASQSTPGKVRRYDVNHLSSSSQRNAFLLQTALQALVTTSDDDMRTSIKEYVHAIIETL